MPAAGDLLQRCSAVLRQCDFAGGLQIHSLLLKGGHFPSSLFAGNSLLSIYCRYSFLADSLKLLDEMPYRNPFSYNTVLSLQFSSRGPSAALDFFWSIQEKNEYSWHIAVTGLVRSGDVNRARCLLDGNPSADAASCNAVVHDYVSRGQFSDAFAVYRKVAIDRCDQFLLATVVGACADVKAYELGKQVHARIILARVQLDAVLGSALVDMYTKCEDMRSARTIFSCLPEADEFSVSTLVSGYAALGQLEEARQLFRRCHSASVVLWNSFISGCATSSNRGKEAVNLFIEMKRLGVIPEPSTYATVYNVCGFHGLLWVGKLVHACGLKAGAAADLVAASALIDFYAKLQLFQDSCRAFSELRFRDTIVLNSMITVYSSCGSVEEARGVFDMIRSKTLISWNSMIVGFNQNGRAVEALKLFVEMRRSGLRLDKVPVSSTISACASICYIDFAEQLYALATVVGLRSDIVIASSLIDLYCKCGNVDSGWMIFEETEKYDEVPWNSMLLGYASNGRIQEAVELFKVMRAAGMRPSEITFLGVLSACCHHGLVDEGLRWFYEMRNVHGVTPSEEHHLCIADMLVRAGRLEVAVDFIARMPFKNRAIWTSVLGGCKAHGNEALARCVSSMLMQGDGDQQAGSYVQLSSVLSAHGDWDAAARVRGMMRVRGITKSPGLSWIDC